MISSVSKIAYCTSGKCKFRKNIDVRALLGKALDELGGRDRIDLVETECLISCYQGPSIMFLPSGKVFQVLSEEGFTETLKLFVEALRHPRSPFLTEPRRDGDIPGIENLDFFGRQKLIVLRNRGHIDGESIEEYIAHDGYLALYKALTALTAEEVIGEMKLSGLRGRGGAGFPTGVKWEEARKYNQFPKYVICNGDEGDPGAFMDRSVWNRIPTPCWRG